MAMAVRSAQLHRRRELIWFLLLTMGLGLCFLGIKAVEYYQEYREHLIPGLNFRLPEHDRADFRSVGPRAPDGSRCSSSSTSS